jgi:cytochrome b6-f complex iron-sulfur subunit
MQVIEKNEELSRGQFLKQLGLSGASLMAFYCLGTSLTSCSSKEADPTPVNPGTGNPGTTKLDFVLDLTTDTYKGLKTTGNFVIKDALIIVNNAGSYVALAKACTHEGTTVEYRKASNDFLCPNHGSVFAIDGAVTKSPATTKLKVYSTETQDSGNKLRVFE